ncbi:MAG: hypothetical protein JJU45_02790 [Acidimicrobiia bacterium]|nr:hypothetical protein [Acidimicrobiia bacterium]
MIGVDIGAVIAARSRKLRVQSLLWTVCFAGLAFLPILLAADRISPGRALAFFVVNLLVVYLAVRCVFLRGFYRALSEVSDHREQHVARASRSGNRYRLEIGDQNLWGEGAPIIEENEAVNVGVLGSFAEGSDVVLVVKDRVLWLRTPLEAAAS